jgi:GNAT superfamily N-acetyltransferase
MELVELTPHTWPLFEVLMGERGGCGGCWCMLYRLPTATFKEQKYEGNKEAMRALVKQHQPIGLMAIVDHEPIGWIAVSPREDVPRIDQSRTLPRMGTQPVWSISCFFVRKEFRRQGVSRALIDGAILWARQHRIEVLEAYPAIPYAKKISDSFLWSGVLSSFKKSGFRLVKRNGKTKAMVRMELNR